METVGSDLRVTGAGAESEVAARVDLLDHGFVEVVGCWGREEEIVEAARMSTQGGFRGWGDEGKPGDEKLLRYLYENKHHTPFEMVGAKFVVRAPIFVFREWHRHRVPFSYNEESARYAPLKDLNYVPTVERLLLTASKTNKQAGTVAGSDELTVESAEGYRMALREMYAEAETLYQLALQRGVPKELARVHLPVGRYSTMMTNSNLRGWLNFLTLRNHHAAQWEIRQYAAAVESFLARQFPRTLALFDEGMRKEGRR